MTNLARDVAGSGPSIDPKTIATYLDALRLIFDLDELSAWSVDLRALAGAEFGRVYHYRDNVGLEIDAVVEYPDGKWGAVAAKLGSSQIPAAERNLLTLRNARVDLDRMGPPAYLAVVTGTEYAYTLPSGVQVIPLATLGV